MSDIQIADAKFPAIGWLIRILSDPELVLSSLMFLFLRYVYMHMNELQREQDPSYYLYS